MEKKLTIVVDTEVYDGLLPVKMISQSLGRLLSEPGRELH